MATKKTATKKTASQTRRKSVDQAIQTLLERLRAVAPPESDRELVRWVLVKMLADMVTKMLEGKSEFKFGSNDLLKLMQTIRDFDAEEIKSKISGIRVEWVEPEKR